MIDLTKLNNYREGNRLEVKLAKGGLPDSTWETYSAFANTDGGIILLGVSEDSKTNTLVAVGLNNPDSLVKSFWDTINNRNKTSANILTAKNVVIEEVSGKKIIMIIIPRANRQDKPLYLNKDFYGQTYRRNGEGDYHCTKAEVNNMNRDANEITQDKLVLDKYSIDILNADTIKRYRILFSNIKRDHVFGNLETEEFLQKIGAIKRSDNDGNLHPTLAGLLMFGNVFEILDEYPNYFLDYREPLNPIGERWSDRVTSGSGDWSGNLYDFYWRVQDRLTSGIKTPFKLNEKQVRIDNTPMHDALREALANALIHADYNERRGIVVEKRKDEITISNPGILRIAIAEAISGGISDPRNASVFFMFSLVGIGERAGSGLFGINIVWEQYKLPKPEISEQFNPDRTILTLKLPQNATISDNDIGNVGNNVDNNVGNVGNNVGNKEISVRSSDLQAKIIAAINENKKTTAEKIAKVTGVTTRHIERELKALKESGLIERIGGTHGYWSIK
ncbi:MAG: putative DNA binding domain-containing protein [Bacillales bacterium]|jgi:predicted HTH transcriptional regulator|nr:putative DNA binding domain-containing protein [Bacillales bacterium]